MRIVLLILAAFGVGACAKSASLYPANEIAASTGVLNAKYMSYGAGHGEIEVTASDGEVLKGEYSLVRGGGMSFGVIFGKAYTGMTTPGGSPGQASLFGNRGTSMQCEFYNDNFSGHGYGGCQSSKGAIYKIQY